MSITAIGPTVRAEPVQIQRSVRPVQLVAPDADVAELSSGAKLLGQLSDHARGAPEAFRALAGDGAREVRAALEDGRLASPDVHVYADALEKAAVTTDAEPLRPMLADPMPSADARRVTDALQGRLESVFGFRLAPLGPWFPRD